MGLSLYACECMFEVSFKLLKKFSSERQVAQIVTIIKRYISLSIASNFLSLNYLQFVT